MTHEEKFVKEIIEYIFTYPDDDYMTMECLCRKLHKHELIAKVDGHWQPLDKRCEDCIFVEGSHWCDGCDKTPKGMKEYDEYWAKADRKTENSSEKPNNCEHITEDGVTCAKYPACGDCLDNPLNKVKGSERLVKGKDEPQMGDAKPIPLSNRVTHIKDEPQAERSE